ncbi:MAG: hypothetical protein WC911_06665 [Thermoleophilia bacterium]
MAMGNAKRKSRITRITILAMMLFAGALALVLSSGTGLASSSSSNINVKVTVMDTVGVLVGKSEPASVTGIRNSQVVTEFVTRTASSRLGDRYSVYRENVLGAFALAGFQSGLGASRPSFDDVAPGGAVSNDKPATEVVVTVSML